MRKIGLLIGVLSLILLGACSNDSNSALAAEGSKLMKISVVTSEDRSLTKGVYKFKEIVEQETEGAIRVEVYADGQLGGDRETFESLQFGIIEATTISTGPVAAFAPRFSLFDFPFLFRDTETAYEILDGPIGKEILGDLEDQNVIGLGYWENGFRHLTNNKREVKTIDDLKGLKIRALENDLHLDFWRAIGANPSPLAYTELFAGMQQGVVDGQENPLGNVTTAKFYEVQKYLTKTNHIYNASVFMVSRDFWDSLSEEEQGIIVKASEESKNYQRKLNAEEEKIALDYLRSETNMEITELSDEDYEEMFQAVQPVWDKYADQIGKDLVEKVIEMVQ